MRLKPCLERLAAALSCDGPDVAAVTISVDMADFECPIEVGKPLALFTAEGIVNALRHAFPSERGGHVVVRFRADSSGEARLAVEDDGVGLTTLGEPGLGLRIMSGLAAQIDGRFDARSRPQGGAVMALEFSAGAA